MKVEDTRQKIWEAIKWLLPTMLFLIPVLWAGYYQAAELLGAQPLPPADTLTKWMLGLLTLWLTSQGLQAIFFERPGQRVEDRIEKRFDQLEEQVDEIAAPRLALCYTRKETFDALTRILADARPASPTHKYVNITYFSRIYPDLNELGKDFRQERDRKLEQGWTWRHLWTVESHEKLESLQRYLQHFGNVPGYLVRVLPTPPAPFMLEMYVVAADDALLSIPSERRAGAVETSFQFKDKESVRHLQNYFDLLWQQGTKIKTSDGIDQTALRELEKTLEAGQSRRELLVTETREATLNYLIAQISKAHQTLDALSINYRAPREGDALTKRYQDVIAEAATRGVRVRRVSFITEPQELEALKVHLESLKDASYYLGFYEDYQALPKKIPFINCLIVDDEEVDFGNSYLGQPDVDRNNISCFNPAVVRAFKNYFDYLWDHSKKLKDAQGIREIVLRDLGFNIQFPRWPVAFIRSGEDNYAMAAEMTRRAPVGSRIDSTSLRGDLSSVKGTVGAYKNATEVFDQTLSERMSRSDIENRWLVRIGSHARLESVKRQLEEFAGARYYQVSVLTGQSQDPLLNLYIVHNIEALLTLPDEVHEPTTAGGAFLFHAKEMVEYLENYFQIMWARAKPLRLRNGKVDQDFLRELEALYPPQTK